MKWSLENLSLEELKREKEELVKTFIGEYNKPEWYFQKLLQLNALILFRFVELKK